MEVGLFGEVLSIILSLEGMLLLLLGTAIGIMGGVLPGISTVMTVAFVATFTFGMNPLLAVLLLAATHKSAAYAAAIPAILLNIPGTPGSAASVLDGYPMAKKGEGSLALSIIAITSFFGNTVGVVLFLVFMPLFIPIAMNFLSYEMFWISIFGVVICAQLSKGDFVKGLISAVMGIILGTVGLDPLYGAMRLTMNQSFLNAGIPLIPAMVGLFGMSEVFSGVAKANPEPIKVVAGKLFRWKEWWPHKWMAFRVSVIGFIVGILPGVGPNVAAFMGYDHAKSSSKNKDEFGQGSVEGLIGAETGNNSMAPGSYACLLTLGVPGDASTAVVLGVLLVHGLQPGATFMNNNPAWVYTIALGMLITGVMFLILGSILNRAFVKCLQVPLPVTLSVVTLLCIIGSFASANRITDVYLMFFFGLVGWLMTKTGFAIAPLILGLILSGGMIDPFFRRGLLAARGDFTVFLTRPISAILVCLLLFTIFRGFVSPVLKARKAKSNTTQ
ncbi:MAG: tripartite tricarboxylate transporter permease [Oscillospiraceae bacterium]|nr:tripartite tricarboxylate transporter permease [Oscillospiraceae bacterium]